MELLSLQFAIFLVALLAAYYVVGRLVGRGQWVVLLLGSLVFYGMAGTWKTLAFVLVAGISTWAAALGFSRLDAGLKARLGETRDRSARKAAKAAVHRRKRLVLLACLALCLGTLAYLKYWNVVLFELGLASSPHGMGLLLPLGISFYTFQALSYLIDTYRGSLQAERSLPRHLTFLLYFPQLIQGPINRYGDLAPQLFSTHAPREVDLSRSLQLLLFGMLKKYAMADLLVGLITRLLAGAGDGAPGSLAILAILLYSAQQYGDFSGGIDMVEAVSELLCIRMAPNFRRPYLSTSLADFWRRWHITLGTWMRDYVFYPLALTRPMRALGKAAGRRLGSHVGRTLPACVANVAVFLLVGLWHGAETHYLVWGLYNGLVIALADLLRPAFDRASSLLRIDRSTRGWHAFRVVRTFVVVNVGWYFDRIYDFGASLACLRQSVLHPDFAGLPQALAALGMGKSELLQVLVAGAVALLVACVSLYEERGGDARGWLSRRPVVVRAAACAVMCLVVVLSLSFGVGGGFMYANY